jgi:hypothetical protein
MAAGVVYIDYARRREKLVAVGGECAIAKLDGFGGVALRGDWECEFEERFHGLFLLFWFSGCAGKVES